MTKLNIEIDAKTIYDKLKSIEDSMSGVLQHLSELNGQVTKNSEFRIQGKIVGALTILIAGPLIGIILNEVF